MNEFNWLLEYRDAWKPLLGGIGVALVAGPLGSLMVWRRLSYFGDTLSHSGLLGVTLALALQINVTFGVCVIALGMAFCLLGLQSRLLVGTDTLLGLLSHLVLALGLLALAAFEGIRVDVLGFLYGDILAITWQDVLTIYMGGALIMLLLIRWWPALLRVCVHRELAQVEGVNVARMEGAYVILLAMGVAIAIKIVGVLLTTALLIIPATAARAWSKTPEQMASIASLLGVFVVLGGIFLSYCWDLPTGPLIVALSGGTFLVTHTIKKLAK